MVNPIRVRLPCFTGGPEKVAGNDFGFTDDIVMLLHAGQHLEKSWGRMNLTPGITVPLGLEVSPY
jgi:hypothetical protein